MKHLRATEQDSEKIKAFFDSKTIMGSIDFSIRRDGNFFDQYRLMSDDYETHLLLDNDEEILGLASLVFREGFVQGEKTIWGYATDLRIAPTRMAILRWAEHFVPILEAACQERRCQYVFSTVHTNDNQVYNALIRPASHSRRSLPRYHLANKFKLIFLHGQMPFAPKPLPSIRLHPLEENDIEALCSYLMERSKLRPMASIYHPDHFLEQLKRWPGLTQGDFRIAKDKTGQIIGCAGLWNSRAVQSLIPQTYHGLALTRHQSLKAMGFFGLARPTPEPGSVFPIRMLTHLACDNAEVFYRLVHDAFSRLNPGEFLAYLHFRGHWRTLPPISYIATSLPMGLYMIIPPSFQVPTWPQINMNSLPPEFEAAWL